MNQVNYINDISHLRPTIDRRDLEKLKDTEKVSRKPALNR